MHSCSCRAGGCRDSPLVAQSSQFGIRGIGLPGRALSVRALGAGGAIALFDGGSSQNPAALALLPSTSMIFATTQSWRNSENPGGELSARDQRFPHIMIGGPVPGTTFSAGLSFSTYADRDFTLVTESVQSPRGVHLGDRHLGSTVLSTPPTRRPWTPSRNPSRRGRTSDRFNRLFSRPCMGDTSYLSLRQTAELTYVAWVCRLAHRAPDARLFLAVSVRQDGRLNTNATASAGKFELRGRSWRQPGSALQIDSRSRPSHLARCPSPP